MANEAMIREGFPADKTDGHRGGMLDWDTLGFQVLKDAL